MFKNRFKLGISPPTKWEGFINLVDGDLLQRVRDEVRQIVHLNIEQVFASFRPSASLVERYPILGDVGTFTQIYQDSIQVELEESVIRVFVDSTTLLRGGVPERLLMQLEFGTSEVPQFVHWRSSWPELESKFTAIGRELAEQVHDALLRL